MSVVAVIPARGGSKGIPRKNLVRIGGQSLIGYAIAAAQGASSVDRVVVSTDDIEIAEVAKTLGAEVPFLRPAALASDHAPMLAVLQHMLEWLQFQDRIIEAIVLLQPTSPMRTSNHIQEAVDLFRVSAASSVVSVTEVPHRFNPVSIMKLSPNGTLTPFLDEDVVVTRRQDKPKAYARNGPAVLVCHPESLLAGELYGKRCIPYIMSEKDSLDIDNPDDLDLANSVLQKDVV